MSVVSTFARSRGSVVLATLLAACLLAAVGASSAGAKTVWLCKPGQTPNPCRESLQTTVVTSAGAFAVAVCARARPATSKPPMAREARR